MYVINAESLVWHIPQHWALSPSPVTLTGTALTSWGWPPERVEVAVLLVSELVTNAHRHAGTDAWLHLESVPDDVRLIVRDRNPAHPTQRAPGITTATGGFGLRSRSAMNCGPERQAGRGSVRSADGMTLPRRRPRAPTRTQPPPGPDCWQIVNPHGIDVHARPSRGQTAVRRLTNMAPVRGSLSRPCGGSPWSSWWSGSSGSLSHRRGPVVARAAGTAGSGINHAAHNGAAQRPVRTRYSNTLPLEWWPPRKQFLGGHHS